MSSWPTLPAHPKPARLIVQPDVQIAEHVLAEARLSGEICSLSKFRATVAAKIEQARSTAHPVIITQHGRSSAVLLGIDVFENLLREIDLLREVRAAENEVADGHMSEQVDVEAHLRGLLGR